jgi:hypothetical protein
MAINIFGAYDTDAATTGALDSIATATINDADMALVVDANEEAHIYRYESSNDNAANPNSDPQVIVPTDNASGTGAWILTDMSVEDLKVYGAAVIDGALTQTGAATFTGLITANGGITMGDADVITWDNAPASDHTYSGDVSSFTAGEGVTVREACYLKSDGKMWQTDADAAATMPVVALATGTINADAAGDFLLRGFIRDDSWNWTVGGLIYASTTKGALTQTAVSGSGDQLQVVGFATHADRMFFNPNYTIIEIA